MKTTRLLGIGVLLIGVCIPVKAEILAGPSKAVGRDGEGIQLLVRSFDLHNVVQMDVIKGNKAVVTFVASFGSGERGVCELVFVNESAWFGRCSVFDFPFSDVTELTNATALMDGGFSQLTYFISASTNFCPPELIHDDTRFKLSDSVGEDMVLHAIREMANWSEEDISNVLIGISVVGYYGCPVLAQALMKHFGIDSSLVVSTGDLGTTESIPDDIAAALDHDRKAGLGDFLDEIVRDLP